MQLSIRLSDQLAKRVQVYLDRGVSKSALVTSALDYYLSALESQPAPILDPTPSQKSKKPENYVEEQIEIDMSGMSRAEKRRIQKQRKKRNK